MNELGRSILRNATGLALFALVTAGIIAITQLGTAAQIKQNILSTERKLLAQVIPNDVDASQLLAQTVKLSELKTQLTELELLGPVAADARIYLNLSGQGGGTLVLPVVAPEGYTTQIDLLVAMDFNGQLSGVRVIRHQETPGLGDKIDVRKSPWIESFVGRSLVNPNPEAWAVKKDGGAFDQLSGATITPRAVVKAVKKSLLFLQENRASLQQIARQAQLNDKPEPNSTLNQTHHQGASHGG